MKSAPNPRAARLAAGLTQSEAASLIGATMRTWQEWEGGRRNMPGAKFALFVMLLPPPEPPNQKGPNVTDDTVKARLEYLRGELRAERISYGELAELQGLAEHIAPDDTELREAAGIPEGS